MKKEVLIGRFSVDAGLVMILDPCYIYDSDGGLSKDFPQTWDGFLRKFLWKNGEHLDYNQMNFDGGYPGLGVISSTGYGDGEYPVYATIDRHGTILSLRIDFDEVEHEEIEEEE